MPSPVYNNYANIITFSRGTNATLTDSTGKITYAPANLLVYSQQIGSIWGGGIFNCTPTTNALSAPDGTVTASLLTSGASTSNTVAVRQIVSTLPLITYTYSAYFKANANARYAVLRCLFLNSGGDCWFDLQTGLPATKGAGVSTTTMTNVGNGWYRCSATGTTSSTVTNNLIDISFSNVDNGWTTVANSSTIYAWGAQLEPVTYQTTPSTYVATTTAAYYGPRLDYDPVTLAVKGMLVEEARTNFAVQSQTFNTSWTLSNIYAFGSGSTVDASMAPDGTTTMDRIVANTTNGAHTIYQAYTFSATTYTFSCYVKYYTNRWFLLRLFDGTTAYYASFDVQNGVVGAKTAGATTTITSVGGSTYRVTVSATLAAGAGNILIGLNNADTAGFSIWTPAGTEGADIWGAQLEAGAFATSYIPTTTASVARSADVASMTGTNFSSWYNQNGGTLVAVADVIDVTGYKFLFNARNGGANTDQISLYQIGSVPAFEVVTSSVAKTLLPSGTVSVNTRFRLAGTYQPNDYAASYNGGTVATNTTATQPTNLNNCWIAAQAGVNQLNGHIVSIQYYPRRLSNAQLQALTTSTT